MQNYIKSFPANKFTYFLKINCRVLNYPFDEEDSPGTRVNKGREATWEKELWPTGHARRVPSSKDCLQEFQDRVHVEVLL